MTTTSTEPATRLDVSPYRTVSTAAVTGIAAGLGFGLLIQFVLGRMPAIGAMYTLGEPTVTVGWIAHIGHSALFGAIYGLLAMTDLLGDYTDRVSSGLLLGGAYGTALWLVNIGFVWPLWLNSVGFGAGLPVPFLAVLPLVGHLVYGVGLGGLFAAVRR